MGIKIGKMNFYFQGEGGMRDCLLSRGLGDVYKSQARDAGAGFDARLAAFAEGSEAAVHHDQWFG